MTSPDHIKFRRAVPADYKAIRALQKANLITALGERGAQEGFLTMEYTEHQFEEINQDLGIAVAVRGRTLLGYLCGMSFSYAGQFPLLSELIGNLAGLRLDGRALTGDTTFIYGPVCIVAKARGTGILAGLFTALKKIAGPRYDACVLFISDRNKRSLHAHIGKLGMKDVGTFEFDRKLLHIAGAFLD